MPRQRQEKDSNGKTITRTVEVEEKCPTCKGRGKVESSGSR